MEKNDLFIVLFFFMIENIVKLEIFYYKFGTIFMKQLNYCYRKLSEVFYYDKKVEEKSNEKLGMGHVLVTMSITNTAKAILVFKKTA